MSQPRERGPLGSVSRLVIVLIVFAVGFAALITWAYIESENLADIDTGSEGFDLGFPSPDGLLPAPSRLLWGLDPSTGQQRWRERFDTATFVVGVTDNVVIVDDFDEGNLVAFDVTTGEQLWRRGPGVAGYCYGVVDRTVVVGVTRKGSIVARDARSGTQLWKTAQAPFDCAGLVPASGTVIVE